MQTPSGRKASEMADNMQDRVEAAHVFAQLATAEAISSGLASVAMAIEDLKKDFITIEVLPLKVEHA